MSMLKRLLSFLTVILLIVSFVSSNVSADDNELIKGENEKKRIALTFDDGPHPRFTGQILDILDEYGVKATFFVIGVNVQNYYESYLKILESGCEIGNHTYSHTNLSSITEEKIRDEILMCADAISSNTGAGSTKLLRPPQGACNSDVKKIAGQLDYDLVFWTIDTMDWAHTPTDAIIDKILREASDGDIILMHDYVSGKCSAPEVLRVIIPALIERGFEFVTVSEMNM